MRLHEAARKSGQHRRQYGRFLGSSAGSVTRVGRSGLKPPRQGSCHQVRSPDPLFMVAGSFLVLLASVLNLIALSDRPDMRPVLLGPAWS